MKNLIKELLRESLKINEIYGKKVIDIVTKKFNDTSEDMKNKIAISSLFRNIFGDINQFKTKEQFDIVYDKWYEDTLNNLTKTTSFPENKELAKKYLDAYITNIKSLGESARPFSMKTVEVGLVDLVNNNRWISDSEIKQANTIYNPKSEDIVFENNEIIILDTNTKAKCVMYGQGESWCITKPELTWYNTYRVNYGATPYFVLQKNVQGVEHKFVIMNYGHQQYAIADRSNSGKRIGSKNLTMPWYKIEEELPNLNGLEKYFPYREINEDERRYNEIIEKMKDFKGDDLQSEINEKIKDLVINGSRVTSEDFIRDFAVSGVYMSQEQLKSLTKESVDSLIESGYFVRRSYADSFIISGNLTTSQINRIMKLKLENNAILSYNLYPYLSEEEYRNYFWKRALANNASTNTYSDDATEKQLDAYEAQIIIKLFPDFDLNVERYDLEKTYNVSTVLIIKPEKITEISEEVLESLQNWEVGSLLKTRPELANAFKKQLNNLYSFQIDDIIEANPNSYQTILNVLDEKHRKEAIYKLIKMDVNNLPKLIKNKYIDINSDEDYERYKYYYKEFPKIFELNPSLLSKLDTYDLRKILVKEPKLFKLLGDNAEKLNDYNLDFALEENPKLFLYIGDYINKVSKWTIGDIIKNKPIALNYIPKDFIKDNLGSSRISDIIQSVPRLAKKLGLLIPTSDVQWVMSRNPKTIKYFPESVFQDMSKYEITNILFHNEKAYPFLEPIIDKYFPEDKEYIISRMD